MDEEHNKFLIAWLKDAHAMEKELVKVLHTHADQAEDYPSVMEMALAHAEQTQQHADWVGEILSDMGEDPSLIKGTFGELKGVLSGMSTELAEDRVIKNGLLDYAAENFEIASYKTLIKMAEKMGHDNEAVKLREILSQEEQMADWIENNLPSVLEQFLQKVDHDD